MSRKNNQRLDVGSDLRPQLEVTPVEVEPDGKDKKIDLKIPMGRLSMVDPVRLPSRDQTILMWSLM